MLGTLHLKSWLPGGSPSSKACPATPSMTSVNSLYDQHLSQTPALFDPTQCCMSWALIVLNCQWSWASQVVKNPPPTQKTRAQSLGREDALEKETATHSSILAWEIPWQRSLAGTVHRTAKELGVTWQLNSRLVVLECRSALCPYTLLLGRQLYLSNIYWAATKCSLVFQALGIKQWRRQGLF